MKKLTEFVGRRSADRNDPPLLIHLSGTVPEEQEAWITEQHVKKII